MWPFDRAGLELAHALRGPALDAVFGGVTWLGSLAVLGPLALLIALGGWRRRAGGGAHGGADGGPGDGRRSRLRYWRDGAGLPLLAVCGAPLLGSALKVLVGRARPALYPPLAGVDSPLSFPSIHAMQVTAAALALWLLWRRRTAPAAKQATAMTPGERLHALAGAAGSAGSAVAAALALAVLAVALSRVYLQVHYPSDVLAGVLLGAGWVWALRRGLR